METFGFLLPQTVPKDTEEDTGMFNVRVVGIQTCIREVKQEEVKLLIPKLAFLKGEFNCEIL